MVSAREKYLTAGTPPTPYDEEVLGGMIQFDSKECRVPNMHPGQATRRERFDFPGRIIVAARLDNAWPDGTNADWKLRDGWPGEHAMDVEFKTKFSHGCHWRFEVWSLPEHLCRRS